MRFFDKFRKKPVDIDKYKLNLKKDTDDYRDYRFAAPSVEYELPERVELKPYFPTVFSQGKFGSCTANGGCAVENYFEYMQKRQKSILSRMFLYNMERINDGTPLTEDSGSSVRQICKTLRKNGVCEEDLFAYTEENFSRVPPAEAVENAKKHRIKDYYRCNSMFDIKYALAQGYPVLVGCEIYEDFYRTGKDGKVPKINTNTECLGGHLMVITGYSKKRFCNKVIFTLRNSWGESIKTDDSWGYAFNHDSDDGYGDGGYGYIDEDNLEKIIMDAWVITGVM